MNVACITIVGNNILAITSIEIVSINTQSAAEGIVAFAAKDDVVTQTPLNEIIAFAARNGVCS